MDRSYASGAAGSAPAAPASPSIGYPTAGNPGTGTPATKPGPYWYHQITEELLAIISAAGITPAQGTLTQLASAIQSGKLFSSAAGGTADALTASFVPNVSSLINGMSLYVRAGSANVTTTPTFTPASGTIAAKTIVKGAGAALAPGDIAGGGHWIELQYDLTFDKWVLLNPATGVSSASVASIQGAFKNLQVSATGANGTVTVSADEIVVEDSSNTYKTLRAVGLSINSGASGANGLDTGSIAASTWYSVWAVFNPTSQTNAGLLSLSATAPTIPSGYTMKARVGWIRTDVSGNKFPISFKQFGRRVQYAVATGSNLTALPSPISGIQGNLNTPVWAPSSVSNFVPTTASAIGVFIGISSGGAMVAPNNSYGALASSSNPPPVATALANTGAFGWFSLESTNIYYASDTASRGAFVIGWEDNI